MIEIIPAIDIIGGHCVRLTRGDYGQMKCYDASPSEMAARYADCGVKRIHVVDLDGAKAGMPVNLHSLEGIASSCKGLEVEWGGGISSDNAVRDVFSAGADCAIIGSVAVAKPELMHSWLERYGASKMILGADVRDGKVAVKGWTENSALGIKELVETFLPSGLNQLICTDISRDGMLEGPSFALYSELQQTWPGVTVTVSGGISSMADIEKLDSMSLRKVIVGKAIYEGFITLEDIRKWSQNA